MKSRATLLQPVPAPGTYKALATGNHVKFHDRNGGYFTVLTEDYVKGMDCPCTVEVIKVATINNIDIYDYLVGY